MEWLTDLNNRIAAIVHQAAMHAPHFEGDDGSPGPNDAVEPAEPRQSAEPHPYGGCMGGNLQATLSTFAVLHIAGLVIEPAPHLGG